LELLARLRPEQPARLARLVRLVPEEQDHQAQDHQVVLARRLVALQPQLQGVREKETWQRLKLRKRI
jgi:hypothetical protein